jgi:hypothetical protein
MATRRLSRRSIWLTLEWDRVRKSLAATCRLLRTYCPVKFGVRCFGHQNPEDYNTIHLKQWLVGPIMLRILIAKVFIPNVHHIFCSDIWQET